MRKFMLLASLVTLCVLSAPADAHRSGCHRWHSCPSDSGSYTCGDLGYNTYCPNSPAVSSVEVPATAPAYSGSVRYTTTSLNLRAGPSANTRKLMTLPKGTAVVLLRACSGGWCNVQVRGVRGYVSQKYLR